MCIHRLMHIIYDIDLWSVRKAMGQMDPSVFRLLPIRCLIFNKVLCEELYNWHLLLKNDSLQGTYYKKYGSYLIHLRLCFGHSTYIRHAYSWMYAGHISLTKRGTSKRSISRGNCMCADNNNNKKSRRTRSIPVSLLL